MLPRLTGLELFQSDFVEIEFEGEHHALLAEARIRFAARIGDGVRLMRGYEVIEMRSHLAAMDIAHAETAAARAAA